MFCTKCGVSNPDGSAFCVNCGNRLQNVVGSQPQTPLQGQYVPPQEQYMNYPPQVTKKNNKNLITGLIIGGVTLLAAVIVLVVLLTGGQGKTGIPGIWYETTGYGGTMTFNPNSTFEMELMGMTFSGTYTFDDTTGIGEITLDYLGTQIPGNIYLKDGTLDFEGTEYTRNYVEPK